MDAHNYTDPVVESNSQSDSNIISIAIPDDESTAGWAESRLPSATEVTLEQLSSGLKSLYTANEPLKEQAASLDASSRKRSSSGKDTKITEQLEGFLETFVKGAIKVLEELSMVGYSHPVIALAVYAFHEVVKLDIVRRDNEKKVLVVLLQMQNMLGPMLQLRFLRHEHIHVNERKFQEERLKEAVVVTTKDIEQCRSDIVHFLDRKAVYKLVLSKRYEKRFAFHIENFAQRRVELQTIISEYTAIGMSAANISLAGLANKMDVTNDKLDRITSLFRSVDSPRERDVFKFFDLHSGPENCVNDPDLLSKLIVKVGESPRTGKSAISDEAELEALRTDLNHALKEDLDDVLEKHFGRFEKVLHVRMKQVSEQLEDQGVSIRKILAAVTTKAVKLKDPEIQRVWRSMNVTSNVVKAKVFVLTFRDHIRIEKSAIPTPMRTAMPLPDVGIDPNTLQVQAGAGMHLNALNFATNLDDWVLEYIDVAYVQPIVEAMDEDGSGFISVQEANKFAAARPKGMSLLHWIAYWAAGWHINIIKYQTEIYSILLQMNEVLPEIHMANRVYVDDFLDHSILTRVDALLRSIKPLPDKNDQNLIDVANTVASYQLDRLKTYITDFGHVVESRLIATTIGEGARVETWIFPIIFLLLQHHLNVIKLARTIVLDPREFDVHIQSLESVFSVFDERMKTLEAKFRQLHRDVDGRYQSFAYGMFYVAFKKTEFSNSENTLMTLALDKYRHSNDNDKPSLPDTSILSKHPGKTFEIDEPIVRLPAPDGHVPHPVEGVWLGWLDPWGGGPTYVLPFHGVIQPIVGNNIKGKAEGHAGCFDLIGTVESRSLDSSHVHKLNIRLDFLLHGSSGKVSRFQGTFDAEKETIEGTYTSFESVETVLAGPAATGNEKSLMSTSTSDLNETRSNADVGLEEDHTKAPDVHSGGVSTKSVLYAPPNDKIQKLGHEGTYSRDGPTSEDTKPTDVAKEEYNIAPEAPERTGDGRFYLTRTPVHLFRFRYLLDGPGTPPCWNAWKPARKRWAFAIEAVLADTRTRMGSRKAFNESLAERRKWLYYAIRCDIADYGVVSLGLGYEPITDKELNVYDTLVSSVSPLYARMYDELAHYMVRRETYIAPVGRASCDVCRQNIAFSRHQCITCKDDDLSRTDSINICYNCINKPFPFRDHSYYSLFHKQSHSLLRSPHRTHNYEFSTTIPQARLISERSKTMFRALEESRKVTSKPAVSRAVTGKGAKKSMLDDKLIHSKTHDDPPPILCACCNKAILLPCWVCIVCSPLTFFCSYCERTNAPITSANQKHSRLGHQILRVYDSVEVEPYQRNQIKDVGRQLEEINSSISLLEEKINKQLEKGQQVKGEVKGVPNHPAKGLARKTAVTNPREAKGLDELESEFSDLSDEGDSPVEPNPAIALTENSAGNIQSELGKRLDTLEVKVEDIGAKMNTLLTLVQTLVSSSHSTTDGSA